MKIVGHRGVKGLAPENTILSFQKAIDLGCDRVELDVHLSKDGRLVVIHDEIVDRTTDGKGKVSDLCLADIKLLNCAESQKVPTLEEVIDICKGKIDIQIELKGEGTSVPVCDMIQKNRMENNVILTSFDRELLKIARKMSPHIKAGLLFKENFEDSLSFAKKLSLEYLCPRSTIVTKEMVDIAHALGILVYAYKVNDLSMWEKMRSLGVDEVGTDFPSLFKVR